MHKRLGANTLKRRAEARSPAAIRRAAKKGLTVAKSVSIAALVCVTATAGAQRLWLWVHTSPRFVVRDIEVRGALRVDSKEIIRLSAIKPGVRIFDIKPDLARHRIMTNCWVRRASVSRRLPHTVIIAVEERCPIALVNVGRVYYVDAEGALMPLFTATYSDLPLISGLMLRASDGAGKRIAGGDMERVQTFFRQADSIDPSILKHVSQIDFSSETMARVTLENSRMLLEIDDRKGGVQWSRFQELLDIVHTAPEGMPQRVNLCYSNLGFAQW